MTDLTALLDYDWMRALHIISVIALMAVMMMLPRLYAYQTSSEPGGELDRKMTEASRKLIVIILNPALVLTWIFGLATAASSNWIQFQMGWMHAKLALVIILSALHGYYVSEGKRLAKGERRRSERFWRIMNEVPMLIAIAVVLLVIIEPF